jgi:hypothetical protein
MWKKNKILAPSSPDFAVKLVCGLGAQSCSEDELDPVISAALLVIST